MVNQVAKQNPIKSASVVVGFLAAIVGLVFLVEDRYASAADITQIQTSHKAAIIQIQRDVASQVNIMRRKQLDDQLFILKFKAEDGTATPLDKALMEKYHNELQDIQGK